MKVFVYFNLHNKRFSVKALEGENKGKIIMHADYLILKDCEYKVSQAGRQRVLTEKRKNVHAGVIGNLQAYSGDCLKGHIPIELDISMMVNYS